VSRAAPSPDTLLASTLRGATKPLAFVLAGHNGSGKSTLWYERLADKLQLPLVNADRLTLSILPEALPMWAQKLRDEDARWHKLSQDGVGLFRQLIMAQRMPFAFETVFSHWKRSADGSWRSKADDIRDMQRAGYFVVLLFVGLTSPGLSVLRVQTRKRKGGHDVPLQKLLERFYENPSRGGSCRTDCRHDADVRQQPGCGQGVCVGAGATQRQGALRRARSGFRRRSRVASGLRSLAGQGRCACIRKKGVTRRKARQTMITVMGRVRRAPGAKGATRHG
jgi:predicted ABC-type ATPase